MSGGLELRDMEANANGNGNANGNANGNGDGNGDALSYELPATLVGKFTDEAKQSMVDQFNQVDLNGNGNLDHDEIEIAFARLGINLSQSHCLKVQNSVISNQHSLTHSLTHSHTHTHIPIGGARN